MEHLQKQFSKIYDKYIDKIYRFVFVKVNSQETAEDITSKVFMKGWEAFKKSQNPMTNDQKIENPQAFLYQIARNLIIDHYRERGRTQVVSADYGPQLTDPRTDLEGKAILNADLTVVKTALKDLSDDHQNVIIWHYLDDLSIKDVAKLLDRSEEATRVLLHRALNSLREKLTS